MHNHGLQSRSNLPVPRPLLAPVCRECHERQQFRELATASSVACTCSAARQGFMPCRPGPCAPSHLLCWLRPVPPPAAASAPAPGPQPCHVPRQAPACAAPPARARGRIHSMGNNNDALGSSCRAVLRSGAMRDAMCWRSSTCIGQRGHTHTHSDAGAKGLRATRTVAAMCSAVALPGRRVTRRAC